MRLVSLSGLCVAVLTSMGALSSAYASCQGAAPQQALDAFNADPVKWMQEHQGGDVGTNMKPLAAQAVNTKDGNFGSSLRKALPAAGSDDGKRIGQSLAQLSSSCSDPHDQGKADKQYINDSITKSMIVNEAANTEYGRASDTTQTASVGGGAAGGGAGGGGAGGGGGGAGTSAVTSQIPTGGNNTSSGSNAADAANSSPTSGEANVGGTVSGSGASTAGTQTIL